MPPENRMAFPYPLPTPEVETDGQPGHQSRCSYQEESDDQDWIHASSPV